MLRLSLVYAILDDSPGIERKPLAAALALWDYARESARAIFASERDAQQGEQAVLCGWIRLHGGSTTPRDLSRGPRRCCR